MEIVFRKFKLEDVYAFKKWGAHSDPRFFQYNFIYHNDEDLTAWYRAKQRLFFRKVYGLFIDDYPLGFVTLKHFNWFVQSAELGIALDPNYLSEGYGTLLLNEFLRYVFNTYPLKTMTLRVAHFNQRAQKSYQKVGFVKIGESDEPYEEQGYKELLMDRYPNLFTLREGILYTTFYKMSIHRDKIITRGLS